MNNPILQNLMQPQNNAISQLLNLKKSMGGDTNAIFNLMVNTNPQFKNFVQQNQGKSLEQIARENGLDINQIAQLLK